MPIRRIAGCAGAFGRSAAHQRRDSSPSGFGRRRAHPPWCTVTHCVCTCAPAVVHRHTLCAHVPTRGGALSHAVCARAHPRWCTVTRCVCTCAPAVVHRHTLCVHVRTRGGAPSHAVCARAHPRWCTVTPRVCTCALAARTVALGENLRTAALPWCTPGTTLHPLFEFTSPPSPPSRRSRARTSRG